MRSFLLSFLFLWTAASATAQDMTLSPQTEITVLTCDSGAELYSLFGHTAIRVHDPGSDFDTVFNFGAFDFSTPNFYLKFVKGDLQYFVTTSSYPEFLYEYRYLGRTVYEQRLNLTRPQKEALCHRLATILSSDERMYTYKFIDRNCTTMVVDLVENATGQPISLNIKDAGRTNRDILYGYIRKKFYANLGISIMFGAKTDEELYKVYLPMQFLESLSKTRRGGQPLAGPAVKVVDGAAADDGFSIWDNCFTYGLFLLLIVLPKNRTVGLSWMMLSGMLGIFLSLVGYYSFHEELQLNYNALLFNPLFVPLTGCILLRKTGAARWLLYVSMGMLAVYFLYMLNKPHLLLLAPVMVVNGVLMGRMLLRLRSLPAVK